MALKKNERERERDVSSLRNHLLRLCRNLPKNEYTHTTQSMK